MTRHLGDSNPDADVTVAGGEDKFTMRLIDYFDRGADLNPERACLIMGGIAQTYRDVRDRSHRIARALIETDFARGAKAANGKVWSQAKYLAPARAGKYHVIAASKADPAKLAVAVITVVNR